MANKFKVGDRVRRTGGGEGIWGFTLSLGDVRTVIESEGESIRVEGYFTNNNVSIWSHNRYWTLEPPMEDTSIIIVGDIVRLKTGTAHIRVTQITKSKTGGFYPRLRGRYVSSGIDVDWRPVSDFVRVRQTSSHHPAPEQQGYMTFREVPIGVECVLIKPNGKSSGVWKRTENHFYEKISKNKWQSYYSPRDKKLSYQAIPIPKAPREPQIWDDYVDGKVFVWPRTCPNLPLSLYNPDYIEKAARAFLAWREYTRENK